MLSDAELLSLVTCAIMVGGGQYLFMMVHHDLLKDS